MKKFYFMLVSLVLMVTTANAQISSMTEVFGKYKFTADLEVVDKTYEGTFSGNCEVELTKSDVTYYLAMLKGFGGATGVMYIAEFNEEAQAGIVRNPNNSQWGEKLHMAFIEGNYPYNNDENNYSEINLTYDAATTNLTYPDFSIVTVDHPTSSATIVATFKNVKLEVIELYNIEIPDLTGEWKYAGELRNPDLSPKGFTMNLTAADEDFKNWNAEFVFEGFEDNVIKLPATFDGSMLTVPFDSVYISESDSIRFGLRSSGTGKKGELVFAYASKTAMSFYSYFYVRKDTIKWNSKTEEYAMAGAIRQVFTDYMEREDPDARDWTGTYTVSVAEDDKLVMDEAVEMPSEFEIVIEKVPGGFAVTEMLGYRMADSNMSNLSFVPGEGDKTAEIKISDWGSYLTMWEDSVYIDGVDCYGYYEITDLDGGTNPVSVTVNEDGTMTLGSFMVSKKIFNNETYEWVYSEPVVAYNGATMAVKYFDWSGTYVLEAEKVTSYDENNYPSTFDLVVELIPETAYSPAYYCVTKIMDNDAWSINSGEFELVVAEDGNSASLTNGNVYSFGEGYFLKMFDVNAKRNPIKVTLNSDNTLSVEDFSIVYGYFDDTELKTVALYENVTLTKKEATSIENVVVDNNAVEGIFDVQGRRIEKITAPGLYIVNGKKVLVK